MAGEFSRPRVYDSVKLIHLAVLCILCSAQRAEQPRAHDETPSAKFHIAVLEIHL